MNKLFAAVVVLAMPLAASAQMVVPTPGGYQVVYQQPGYPVMMPGQVIVPAPAPIVVQAPAPVIVMQAPAPVYQAPMPYGYPGYGYGTPYGYGAGYGPSYGNPYNTAAVGALAVGAGVLAGVAISNATRHHRH